MFTDKILLITGGTGSFRERRIKAILKYGYQGNSDFSRDEKKQDDMRKHYQHTKIKFYIGDVRDIQSIHNAMYNVDYVFHAAALKQVSSCEFFLRSCENQYFRNRSRTNSRHSSWRQENHLPVNR